MTDRLRFENVTLWRGGRRLFEDLGFTLHAGEGLHVAGPNGAGKSSLIRLAAGLLHAHSGRVWASPAALVDDRPALDPELPLRRALAFWLTGAQAGERIDAALDTLALTGLAAVPVRLLSSGQLRRVALARVAASGAPLWLLDEPFNGLDSDSRRRAEQLMEAHRRAGGAVLIAAHGALAGDWPRLELCA